MRSLGAAQHSPQREKSARRHKRALSSAGPSGSDVWFEASKRMSISREGYGSGRIRRPAGSRVHTEEKWSYGSAVMHVTAAGSRVVLESAWGLGVDTCFNPRPGGTDREYVNGDSHQNDSKQHPHD
mgnify:CR=1 FL=1